jgi:predicted RNA-binding Zn ribbon-like protein
MARGNTIEMASDAGTDEGPFVFVGGALALDLVNTDVVIRGKPKDLLDTPDAFADWWRTALALYPGLGRTELDEASLPDVKALRAVLRRMFEAVAGGREVDAATLDALNRVLDAGRHVVEVADDGAYRAAFHPRTNGPDATLVPIAWSAFELLTHSDLARLHDCANERCVLLFYDTTRSGTRRWCSVGCMNRARSAERYWTAKRSRAAS